MCVVPWLGRWVWVLFLLFFGWWLILCSVFKISLLYLLTTYICFYCFRIICYSDIVAWFDWTLFAFLIWAFVTCGIGYVTLFVCLICFVDLVGLAQLNGVFLWVCWLCFGFVVGWLLCFFWCLEGVVCGILRSVVVWIEMLGVGIKHNFVGFVFGCCCFEFVIECCWVVMFIVYLLCWDLRLTCWLVVVLCLCVNYYFCLLVGWVWLYDFVWSVVLMLFVVVCLLYGFVCSYGDLVVLWVWFLGCCLVCGLVGGR